MPTTNDLAAELAKTLIRDVQQSISVQVTEDVSARIAQLDIQQLVQDITTELAGTIVAGLTSKLEDEVAKKSAAIDVTQTISAAAVEQTTVIIESLKSQLTKQVQADVAQKLATVDVQMMLREYVDRTLGNAIKTVNFPDKSIPGSAIDLSSFHASGENIVGGIIQKFGSTGIQDSASHCILTIMDEATVVENRLVAASADIKGDLTVDGDLNLTGEIDPDSPFFKDVSERAAGLVRLAMTKEMFDIFVDTVFTKIKTEGVDLSKLTLNGKEIVKDNHLGHSITESNLQKLGHLKTLEVEGESTLGNALFVGNKRIGIGTTEPVAVLDIWDSECQVLVKKLRQNVGVLGTERNQQLVLSANSKENLTLEVDGSVTIPKLNVGETAITSSATMPTYEAKPGTWVINSAPAIGKPSYWVSLGGARWASAGILS